MEFSIIAAFVKGSRGIGYKNKLPWKIPEEMAYFKKITTQEHPYGDNCVIMGRKTWESLPLKYRPLPNRKNIIVSTTMTSLDPNVLVAPTFEYALGSASSTHIFVIGGEKVFAEAIKHSMCKTLYLTEIEATSSNNIPQCDVFFPPIPCYFKESSVSEYHTTSYNLKFKKYENLSNFNSDEKLYLNLLKDILYYGEEKVDRTKIGTLSIFGSQLTFSLMNDVIPLITTKKVFWKGIVEELLFFLRGDHDNRKLQSKGVHIWDGNTSAEYFRKNGMKLEEHDLGVAYGVQWRAAGAKLEFLETDYRGKGIDQIQEVIHLLKTEPTSRRIIINAWNVPSLKDMALMPCHVMYQFNVSHGKYLNCMMTQRSADTFLGLPFNIASTALLTKILASVSNLIAGKIIINLGDAHIYKNHISQVKTQITRTPILFPKLKINKTLNDITDIEKLSFEDFELQNYHSWPGIKADMAV
jgi:dihydrofolate reductase/thymidylate synthase